MDTILYVCILIIEYVVFTRLHETLLNFSLDYYSSGVVNENDNTPTTS